jgi:hypothetical protein
MREYNIKIAQQKAIHLVEIAEQLAEEAAEYEMAENLC